MMCLRTGTGGRVTVRGWSRAGARR